MKMSKDRHGSKKKSSNYSLTYNSNIWRGYILFLLEFLIYRPLASQKRRFSFTLIRKDS